MLLIYGHPFAAYAWKALIAAYERNVLFEFRMVDPDHPENQARIRELSPTGQFPAIIDGEREITQSNAVIEYLDRIGDVAPLIPADRDLAFEARMLAEIFDNYVNRPEGDIVLNALRGPDEKDPLAEQNARKMLDQSYAWLGARIGKHWAVGETFTIADCAAAPALFYADWVHPIPDGALKDYRSRLLARPSVARVVDGARPYRHFFPLGAPDRD